MTVSCRQPSAPPKRALELGKCAWQAHSLSDRDDNVPISKHAFNEEHAVAVPKNLESLKSEVGRRLEIGVRHPAAVG